MKTVLWVILALIVAISLFVIIGVISPGQKDSMTVDIAAPLALTWDTYHDAALMPEWIPGFESIVHTSGEPESVGATYDVMLRDESDNQTKMYETITAFDDYEEFGMDFTNVLITGSTNVVFEEINQDSTRLIVNNHYKGNEWWTNSLLQFFNSVVNAGTKEQYEKLKKLVEKRNIQSVENTFLDNSEKSEKRDTQNVDATEHDTIK